MRILVISDTHHHVRYIEAAKKLIADGDILIHLGDNVEDAEELAASFKGKTYIVAGNCDFTRKYPKENIIEVHGKKIFFTHGDLYGVKNSIMNIFYKGKETGADVVLFGHTHEHGIEREDGIIIMNPGSISLPRSRGRFAGVIDITENGEIDAYLRELKID